MSSLKAKVCTFLFLLFSVVLISCNSNVDNVDIGVNYEVEQKCYNMSVRVEEPVIPSMFYLCLNVLDFNKPLSVVLKDAKKDSPEFMLKKVIDLFKENNLTELEKVTVGEGAEAWLKLYHKQFKNVDDPVLISRYDAGELHDFSIALKDVSFPTGVMIVKTAQGYAVAFNEYSAHPLMQNITGITYNTKKNNTEYYEVSEPVYNTEIALPVPGGETTVNPVYLRFNGYNVSYPMFSNKIKVAKTPSHLWSLLSFYEKSFVALNESRYEEYAEFFAPDSKKMLMGMIKKGRAAGQIDWLRSMEAGTRQVYYVMCSDNFCILFFQRKTGEYTDKRLNYDVILIDADGKMLRANYRNAFEGAFDSLLQMDEFEEKFIKELINAPTTEVKTSK